MLIYTEDHGDGRWRLERTDKRKVSHESWETEAEAIAARPHDRWAPKRQQAVRRTICHYHLQKGMLNFCADSPHALKGTSVRLPDIPEAYIR